MAAQQILDFYEEYKEKYNIKSIEEITEKLDQIKKNIEKLKGSER